MGKGGGAILIPSWLGGMFHQVDCSIQLWCTFMLWRRRLFVLFLSLSCSCSLVFPSVYLTDVIQQHIYKQQAPHHDACSINSRTSPVWIKQVPGISDCERMENVFHLFLSPFGWEMFSSLPSRRLERKNGTQSHARTVLPALRISTLICRWLYTLCNR